MRWWVCGGVAAWGVFGGPAAYAHDFWIDPSTYRPATGAIVDVGLRLGHGPDARTVARNDDNIERFELVAGDRRVPVAGAMGQDPAGRVAIPAAGCWWVVYRGRHSFSALEPARFSAYLQRRGLEDVAADREMRGESERYGTEVYSRCAKALLVGDGCDRSPAARRPIVERVGLTLEIVPEADPARLHPGDRLPLRVLFRARPLAGVLLEAIPAGDRTRATSARTGADGRVRVPLERGGRWQLSAVHMERAAGPERADWESWWASLSFELTGARWRERRFDRKRLLPGVPVPIQPLVPGAG